MNIEKHEYSHPSGKLTVIWQPKLRIHSGICVKMLPQVYNPKERPWAKPENATVEQLKEQINSCPSGALSYIKNTENMTEVKHNTTDKNFEIFQNGKHAGLMTYTWAGEDKFIIDHTEFVEQYGGLGLGKKLVEAPVNFAREKGVRIIPLCPFAKKTIEKTPEFQDVL